VKMRTTSAAYDLGLTEEAREDYAQRLALLFREGCAIFGSTKAAKLFRDQARTAPKTVRRERVLPPRKRKGSHDPETDRLLLMSWKTFNGSSKQRWAEMALKSHAVKNRGKVREQTISARSLVRRLNRLLKLETNRKA
jgi:hypothetical protein